MAGEWTPDAYRDEFRERLHGVIEKRLKQKGVVEAPEDEAKLPENAATNVVDFMSLLKKSIDTKQRTPAAKKAPAKAAKKASAKSATKKKPAAKSAAKRRKSA
jgi:DNA end-binding protein Ku